VHGKRGKANSDMLACRLSNDKCVIVRLGWQIRVRRRSPMGPCGSNPRARHSVALRAGFTVLAEVRASA